MITLLICSCCLSPGEPFNGQLELTDGTDHEDENLHRETDTHTGQSTGTFPVIQPGRFPSHQPDNQVPAVQPPRRNREHNWKQVGTTECTTSCGKGKCFTVYAQYLYYTQEDSRPGEEKHGGKSMLENPANPCIH